MYWICISFSKISMETFNDSLLKLNNYGRGSYRYQMIFTFGEEFGWRGYLLPRLAAPRKGYHYILGVKADL